MSTAKKLAGAVLPSFMRMKRPARSAFLENSFNDTTIKVGTVVAAYSPKDKNNFSQSVWEYDVDIMTSRGVEVATTTTYRNCHMQSYFGGISDKMLWTPRVQVLDKDAQGNPTGTVKQPGTVVMVECVQGITLYGVIVGCMQPELAGPETEDFGDGSGGTVPTLAWQYNGVRVDVNPDGELTVQRRGATQNDGSYKNGPTASPPKLAFDNLNTTDNDSGCNAMVSFTKDGNIVLQTGDGKNSVTWDASGGKIAIVGDQEVDITGTQGDVNVTCGTGKKVSLTDGIGTFTLTNGQFKLEGSAAELVDTLCTLVQTLLSTTVLTMAGPQPFDVATLTDLAMVFANLQTLKG